MFDLYTAVFYVGVVLLTSLLAYSAEKTPKKFKVFLIIMAFTLVAGLRATTVGNDTQGYYEMFEYKTKYSFVREEAFVIYVKLLMFIFRKPQLCIFVSSLITNALVVAGFWKIREYFSFKCNVMAYACIPFFLTMSGLRQWLAVSIVVFFLRDLFENRYIKVSLAIFGASLLHTSTLIAFAFVVFMVLFENDGQGPEKNMSKPVAVLVVFIPILVFTIRRIIGEYASYLEEVETEERGGILMSIFRVGILAIYIAFCFFYRKELSVRKIKVSTNKEVAFYDKKQSLMYLTLAGNCFYVITCILGVFFQNVARFGWPFIITQGFMLGLFEDSENDLGFWGKMMLYVLFFYSLYTTLTFNGNGLLPYVLYWNGE